MAATMIAPAASIPLPHADAHKKQADQTVTLLLATFAGLGLPRTLSLPVKASTTVHDVLQAIYARLPEVDHPLIITTTANKQLLLSSCDRISTFLSQPSDTFLPLRLSARLCGGKGGFGSQLRAAGGRMSSRKKRDQQNQNPNGSNRNLDGRRLRTVDTAKKLAEHLATKSDVENKAKEERRKKLEEVISNAERTEEAIKSGKMGSGQGRLDADYVESKEQAEEKTREAVRKAMMASMADVERTGSESSMEEDDASDEDDPEEGSSGSSEEAAPENMQTSGPSYFGWDDDEYDDSEDDDDATRPQPATTHEGKGKAKAV